MVSEIEIISRLSDMEIKIISLSSSDIQPDMTPDASLFCNKRIVCINNKIIDRGVDLYNSLFIIHRLHNPRI